MLVYLNYVHGCKRYYDCYDFCTSYHKGKSINLRWIFLELTISTDTTIHNFIKKQDRTKLFFILSKHCASKYTNPKTSSIRLI